MKKLAIILTALVTLTLFSCKKENIEPQENPYNTEYPDFEEGYQIAGKSFVLISGKVFTENVTTGDKVVYDHFGDGKTVSGMRVGAYEYDLEKLEEYVTTWSFIATNVYELRVNGDSLNPYQIQETSYSKSIIEHNGSTTNGPITIKMGGSSKPFTIKLIDEENDIIRIYINEGYFTDDTQQYTYFNELDFQLVK